MEATVRAYKFLAPGAVGPFSGFAWPTGTPGPWVEAVPHTCATGVHACLVEDLPRTLASASLSSLLKPGAAETADPVMRKPLGSRW